jgi:hypothetical protein
MIGYFTAVSKSSLVVLAKIQIDFNLIGIQKIVLCELETLESHLPKPVSGLRWDGTEHHDMVIRSRSHPSPRRPGRPAWRVEKARKAPKHQGILGALVNLAGGEDSGAYISRADNNVINDAASRHP